LMPARFDRSFFFFCLQIVCLTVCPVACKL
jgi:hypothetical protein